MPSNVLEYTPINIIIKTEPFGSPKECRILVDHARSLYLQNHITKETFIKLMDYIMPMCLERAIEDKINEIIPKWNKRFSNFLYANMEE